MARTQTQSPTPAAPASPQILDANTAADVRERLADRRSTLALLQGQRDAIEEQRAGLLLARSLGESFNTRALLELTEQRDALIPSVADEEASIQGLERLLAVWEGAEQERELALVLAELQEIHATAPELENRYLAAIDSYVQTSGDLLEASKRFDQLMSTVDRLRQGRDVVNTGLRSPCKPFVLPEAFMTVRPSARALSWPDYRNSMLQYRPDWRHRNPPDPVDSAAAPWWQRFAGSPARMRFEVLRSRFVANPGRAIAPEGGREYVAGRFEELPADEAAWIERDSPGTLQPVEAA